MRLISLNIWGGIAGKEKVLSFLEKNSDVDIFCLQEVWSYGSEELEKYIRDKLKNQNASIMTDGLYEISHILQNHTPYFAPIIRDMFGQLVMVHNKYTVISNGELFVYREKGYIPPLTNPGMSARAMQHVTISTQRGDLTIMNLHGFWNGINKKDSTDRLVQSKKIADFVSSLKNPYVLAGDFNLLPETRSIQIIEETGARNLVREFKVQSTRSPLYTKPERHADYIFLHPKLKVRKFTIMPDIASDHSPLYVEWEY